MVSLKANFQARKKRLHVVSATSATAQILYVKTPNTIFLLPVVVDNLNTGLTWGKVCSLAYDHLICRLVVSYNEYQYTDADTEME